MPSVELARRERGIVRPNLDQVVCDTIREMIFSGELRMGERLIEERLATQLNVSRTPIKLSLMQLAKEGIVEHESRKGASVKVYGIKEAIEIYQIRSALYGLCARLAVERMTQQDAEALEGLVDEHERFVDTLVQGGEPAIQSSQYSKHLLMDRNFHLRIAEAAHNDSLTELVRNSSFVLNFILALAPDRSITTDRVRGPLAEHKAILASLLRRDVREAEALSREHSIEASRIAESLARSTSDGG